VFISYLFPFSLAISRITISILIHHVFYTVPRFPFGMPLCLNYTTVSFSSWVRVDCLVRGGWAFSLFAWRWALQPLQVPSPWLIRTVRSKAEQMPCNAPAMLVSCSRRQLRTTNLINGSRLLYCKL